MTDDLAELVALLNARMPGDGPFRLDPAREVTLTCDWGSHYWTLSDGKTRHQWQHVKPDTRNPLRDPFILWTEDAATALRRILAVERRRAGKGHMRDKNGVPVTIGVKVRFTGDLLGGRWVEGWVRDTGEHTYYHPRRVVWEARVDNGDRESDDFATNGASIAAWVVSEDIEVVS